MPQKNAIKKILGRNILLIESAIVFRRALIGIEDSKYTHKGWTFIVAADRALFYSMIAYAILCFNKKEQAGFWQLVKTQNISKNDDRLTSIELIMLGLNRIRDKTHFHLDRVGLDQDKIWEEANITGHQLATALDDAYSILCEIYLQLHGIHRERVDYYDGSDAKVISKRAMFGD